MYNNTRSILENNNNTAETTLTLELRPHINVAEIANQHLQNNTQRSQSNSTSQPESVTQPATTNTNTTTTTTTSTSTSTPITENNFTQNTNYATPTADDLVAIHDYRQRNIVHNYENNHLRHNTNNNATTSPESNDPQTSTDDFNPLPALKKVKENIKKQDPNNNNHESNQVLDEPEKAKEVIDNSVANLTELANQVTVDTAQNAVNQQQIATVQTRLDNLLEAYTNFTVQYPRISLGITLLGLGGAIYAMYRSGYFRQFLDAGIGIAPLRAQIERYSQDMNQIRQEQQNPNHIVIRPPRDLTETGIWFTMGIFILKTLRII